MEESYVNKCLHWRKEGIEKKWEDHESWQIGVRIMNKWMEGFYGKKNKSQRKGETQKVDCV